MNQEETCFYLLSDEIEKEIWKDCIFVFDTSALLEFYFYSDSSQDKLFKKVFKHLEGRLWIPHHVEFEYNKNRGDSIKKPIDEKYKPIQSENIKEIIENVKMIKNKIEDLQQKTKKKDTHPYFEQQIFSSIVTDINKLLTSS